MIPKIKMLIVDVDGTLTDGGVYVDEDGKETRKQLYPNEARLRNLSYASHLFCNIEIEYKILNDDGEGNVCDAYAIFITFWNAMHMFWTATQIFNISTRPMVDHSRVDF